MAFLEMILLYHGFAEMVLYVSFVRICGCAVDGDVDAR